MALAVKNASTSPQTPSPWAHWLAVRGVDSVLGAAYTLASIGLVFYGLPLFWDRVLHFVQSANGDVNFVGVGLLLLAMVVVGGALGYLGFRLLGAHPRPGLRAGIALGCFFAVIAALLTSGIGQALQGTLHTDQGAAGVGLTLGIFVVLLGLVAWMMTRPWFDNAMVGVDAQGWFTLAPFKRTQGQKVRRGTILGILVLALCGIWVLHSHLPVPHGDQPMAAWTVTVPFSGGQTVTLLPALSMTLPVLLGVCSFWFAYRVVNVPVFADFLIATEAEMNKVSWTTRQRLVQDTIVVLVTVILLTLFLYVIDLAWSFALTRIGVIQLPTPAQKAETTPQW